MRIAGIRSNRGDRCQTMIAFDWALAALSDPNFECLGWLNVMSQQDPDQILISCQSYVQISGSGVRMFSWTDLAVYVR